MGILAALRTLREILNGSRITTKRVFKCYGYPPDLLEEAVKTVLAEAAQLCAEWVAKAGC